MDVRSDGSTEAGIVKVTIAWFGVWLGKIGIHAWSDVAAVLAAIYSALLIADWCWKKWKKRRSRT
jgi:preprotein translocase subunit SecF